jgi:hypothetical protein
LLDRGGTAAYSAPDCRGLAFRPAGRGSKAPSRRRNAGRPTLGILKLPHILVWHQRSPHGRECESKARACPRSSRPDQLRRGNGRCHRDEGAPLRDGRPGDFTGHPAEPLAKLKERKFVEITPDNFDDVLKSMKPHLQFTVDNLLSEDPEAGKIGVDLKFESMDDFSPDRVAAQVDPSRSSWSCDRTWPTSGGACRGTTSWRRSFRPPSPTRRS